MERKTVFWSSSWQRSQDIIGIIESFDANKLIYCEWGSTNSFFDTSARNDNKKIVSTITFDHPADDQGSTLDDAHSLDPTSFLGV